MGSEALRLARHVPSVWVPAPLAPDPPQQPQRPEQAPLAARARDFRDFGSVWILGATMDPARAQVWLQRALDNWHLAEAHDIGVIAIIALVLLSSCFYVWTIVKSLLPKPALKKD